MSGSHEYMGESIGDISRLDARFCAEWLDIRIENKSVTFSFFTLLPKLISGELRVKDAELVAEVAA